MTLSKNYPLLTTVMGNELTNMLVEHLIEIEKVGRDKHLQECDIWQWCGRLNESLVPEAFNSLEFGLANISLAISIETCIQHFKAYNTDEYSIQSFIQEVSIGSRLSISGVLSGIEIESSVKGKYPDFKARLNESEVYFECTYFFAKDTNERFQKQAEENDGFFGGTSDVLSSPEMRALTNKPKNEPIDRQGPEPDHQKIIGVLEKKSKKFTTNDKGIIVISLNFPCDMEDIIFALYGPYIALISKNKSEPDIYRRAASERTFYNGKYSDQVYGVLFIEPNDTQDLWTQRTGEKIKKERHKKTTFFPNYQSRKDIDLTINQTICKIFDAELYMDKQ